MTGMPISVLARPLSELVSGFAAAVPGASAGDSNSFSMTPTAAPDVLVSDLTLDSRQVQPGGLFLACRGIRDHGLKFLQQAISRGAAAVLWEPAPGIEPPQTAIPTLAVEKLSERAGEIAARFFGHPSKKLHCIGVTGTDGKTSTAYLLAQALDRMGHPSFYIGTLGWGHYDALHGGDLTTPDPVNLQRWLYRAVKDGCEAMAMEVSSIGLHQSRVAGMQFHTAVLTNISRDHLDYHRTLENYAAAKHSLFERQELRSRILNRDDAAGAAWAREFPQSILYGLEGAAPGASAGDNKSFSMMPAAAPGASAGDSNSFSMTPAAAPAAGRYVLGRNLKLSAQGIAFDVDSHAGKARIESRLLGRFNAYNLLAALSALLEKTLAPDASLDEACAALSACVTVPGRIEGFRGPKAKPLVVVDYAHTPQALEQVLQALRAHVAPGASAGDNKSFSMMPAAAPGASAGDNKSFSMMPAAAPGASAGDNKSFSMTPAAAPGASAGDNKSFSMTPAAVGKLWCVFGCGGDRDRGKRPLMGAAAARFADRVIVTDDNPRSEEPAAITREIQAGFPAGFTARVIHARAEAIEAAVREAAAGDVVVVAGKGHETTQTYGREARPFSDRAFVARLVGRE